MVILGTAKFLESVVDFVKSSFLVALTYPVMVVLVWLNLTASGSVKNLKT